MEWGNNPNTYMAVLAICLAAWGAILFFHKVSGWIHSKIGRGAGFPLAERGKDHGPSSKPQTMHKAA